MLTMIRPGTMSKGATYFIVKAMTMIADRAAAYGATPFGESTVERVARQSVNLKLIHREGHQLFTQEELDQLQSLLLTARGLALACRFDPRWDGWDRLPAAIEGNPIADLDQIITDTRTASVAPPATAAAA